MRIWLGIQGAIVLAYFALTFLFWGEYVILFLSIALVPLFIFMRVERLAMVSEIVVSGDFQVVSLFLLLIGVLLAVIPYVMTELYWQLKELFFQPGRGNLFWGFGLIVFVVTGIHLAWFGSLGLWTSFKNRHKGVQTLLSAFNSIVLAKRPMKITFVAILAMILTAGLGFGVGALLVWFGGYSISEIFYEPTIGMRRLMIIGGFLLGLFPVYFVTSLWWRKAQLASALESDIPSYS